CSGLHRDTYVPPSSRTIPYRSQIRYEHDLTQAGRHLRLNTDNYSYPVCVQFALVRDRFPQSPDYHLYRSRNRRRLSPRSCGPFLEYADRPDNKRRHSCIGQTRELQLESHAVQVSILDLRDDSPRDSYRDPRTSRSQSHCHSSFESRAESYRVTPAQRLDDPVPGHEAIRPWP